MGQSSIQPKLENKLFLKIKARKYYGIKDIYKLGWYKENKNRQRRFPKPNILHGKQKIIKEHWLGWEL